MLNRFVPTSLALVILILPGCTGIDHPPARKSWFSVEKAPMKIIYIDAENSLDPCIMTYMVDAASKEKYHKFKFTDTKNEVGISGKSEQSDVESDKDETVVDYSIKTKRK